MAEKKPIKKEVVKNYTVIVTGFYDLGKMFRAGAKIDGKIYKAQIEKWLKNGFIK